MKTIYIKSVFLNSGQFYLNCNTDHTIQDLNITKMLYKCEHCDYASDRKYNLKKHEKNIHEKFLHEAASYSAHCDYKSSNKKHMNKEDARKGDMTKHKMRNIINEGFDVFQLYMKMKLQSVEFEDEEMIEESINVFKHYMLNKIDE